MHTDRQMVGYVDRSLEEFCMHVCELKEMQTPWPTEKTMYRMVSLFYFPGSKFQRCGT
jgi:hypothetical protein